MTTNFENDDNNMISESDSIFEDTQTSDVSSLDIDDSELIDLKEMENNNFIIKFLDTISHKLLNGQEEKELKKLQKQATKLFEGNEKILQILNNFNCHFVYKKEYIELQCERFKLAGKIYIEEDGSLTFDDVTKAIIYQISEIVRHSTNVNNILDENEEKGFYPIGELSQQKIIFKGREREVLTGTLINNKGETKQIYYYKGKEVFPDE